MRQRTAAHVPQATGVAILLLAVYWLTASGEFHSIDEHAVFAVARNMVFQGGVDESTLFWGSPYDEQARVGIDGELHSKYGVGHSLLVAAAIGVVRIVPGAGLASSAMFLGALATALTAWFLVLCAGRLGYSTRTSVSIGLLFGLPTFSWVYAKTMFGEPLVALGWIAVLWVLLTGTTWKHALVAGTAMAATVSIRPALVVAIFPFSLLLWDRNPQKVIGRLTAFAVPVAAVMAGLLGFNQVRFGDPLQFGYSETFSGSLLAGLGGFLFSLDRSIFIFAPPLVGLLWSIPTFFKRHGSLGWKILAVVGLILFIYSKWAVFWGGPVWGPRYLLPILPLLVVLLLPAVDGALSARSWSSWVLVALVILGIAIQLPAVIWNPLAMTQTLGQRYPLWLLRPQAGWLDIAWLNARWESMLVATGLGFLALAVLRWPRRWLVRTAALSSLVSSILLLSWLGQSSFVAPGRIAFASALSHLEVQGRAGDALVLNPPHDQESLGELAWFLNEPRAIFPFYGVYRLPHTEQTPSDARVEHLLERFRRLWLLTSGVQPGDPASTTERYLTESAAVVGTWWLEDGYRLSLFEALRPPTLTGVVNTPLDRLAMLEKWEISSYAGEPASLQVALWWRALGPTTVPLHGFVQALDEHGTLVAGWDGVPHGGFAASTGWRQGELVQESSGTDPTP